MDIETVQTNDYGEAQTEIVPVEATTVTEPVMMQDVSTNESVEESWRAIQAQSAAFFASATASTTAFFKSNRQLLTTLSWVLLALLGLRLLLGALDAFDDIPLVTPILKLIGFVYVVQFTWRYLVRERKRQELVQMLERAKAEMFGSQS